MNLLDLTTDQLADQFHRRYGKGHYHAKALYRAFYHTPDLDLGSIAAFAAASRLRGQVQRDLAIELPEVVERISADGVVKLVYRLTDGLRVERR